MLFLLQHCQVNCPLAWWTDSTHFAPTQTQKLIQVNRWRTKPGVQTGGRNWLQRWKGQYETLRSACEYMVWVTIQWDNRHLQHYTELLWARRTAAPGKPPFLQHCQSAWMCKKKGICQVLVFFTENTGKVQATAVTLSLHFVPEYVKDHAATVALGKKQQSRSNQASGMLKHKWYPLLIWLPGARRLPPWWHLWKSPQSNFSEVCSYSVPVPPFTMLRWWSALFMDSNGIFFFQNNHCIIGIMPLIVCYGLSNTWVVNNSWLSAIWSIVRADWRLTIKAFKNN